LNGNNEYKVQSLTIFPTIENAPGFNPEDTVHNIGVNDFPLPHTWDFIDDLAWTTVANGLNIGTGKYKNRPLNTGIYKDLVAFPDPANPPTESIYGPYDDESGETPLLGHYDNTPGGLVPNLD